MPQEQLRRQGQQLRLPRELPDGPGGAVRSHRRARSPRTSSRARSSAAPARSAARRPAVGIDDVPFQLSQRADFFEEEVGLETTLKRPIVNTRDEPHCDASEVPAPARDRRRRQHERGRDLPEGRHHRDRAGDDRGRRAAATSSCFGNPVGAIRQVSPTTSTLRATARAARRHHGHRARGPVGAARAGPQVRASRTASACVGEDVGAECSRRWEAVLTGLEADPIVAGRPGRLGGQAAPGRRLRASATASTWDDARLTALDLQYHDLRPDKCLAARLGVERLTTDDEVALRDDRAAPRHPGLLPGPLPARVGRRHRGRQLGLDWCSTSAAIRCVACR